MSQDRIALTGLRAHGHHGVLAQERRAGQDFVVDAVLHVDAAPAGRTDDLADTVDYGSLAAELVGVVQGEPVDLLETLAGRLAGVCAQRPGVVEAEVTVHKPAAPLPVPFGDVAVTVRRRPPPSVVVLAIGGNLASGWGDRRTTLQRGLELVAACDGVTVAAVSPVWETAAVGGPPAQPDHLNAVAHLHTTLAPEVLLGVLHVVEAAAGRERKARWGPRTLDLDLVTVGPLRRTAASLVLPHPRAHERAFVLAPWHDLDPTAVLPGHGAVADLLAAADRSGVRRRDDLVLRVP